MSHPRLAGAALWTASLFLVLAAAGYQRRTGPTHPLRGELPGGAGVEYALVRSGETTRSARVAVPRPEGVVGGTVLVRRFPTDHPFTPIPMREETVGGRVELAAYLPPQPPAGKLEYRLSLETAAGEIPVPAAARASAGDDEATVVMRFKDPVPLPLLLAHVVFMFLSMLVGIRAALGAVRGEPGLARLAGLAFGGMTIGGMILGPLVQKAAFGAYWTGFPLGHDLTDNKTLIMWLAWAVACGVLARSRPGLERPAWGPRLAVVVAAVVMLLVYLVPHSLRGSERAPDDLPPLSLQDAPGA
jgi:hypothetical protein